MYDSRLDALAEQLVDYSVALKSGEKVLIELEDVPEVFGIALVRAVRLKGGLPFLRSGSSLLRRELYQGASQSQIELQVQFLLNEIQEMDACILVRGSHNVSELSDVNGQDMNQWAKALRPVMEHRIKETKWVVLRWPTSSMAQLAAMSTEQFENFFFNACLLDYQKLDRPMQALKQLMEKTDQVIIKGEGTNLSFSIKGMSAVVCGGRHNLPDGEVFTAPVKHSIEGTVHYNTPTLYQGHSFSGVTFEFRQGKIVKASAREGDNAELNRILNCDEGARFIGEFALGFHPEILHPMRDILFDEKIAGSFHLTPGQAYGEADNGNKSQIHWDLVSIQRSDYGGGEVFFDGQLIRKDGVFIPQTIKDLNP